LRVSAVADPMDALERRSLDQIADAAAELLGARVVLISLFDGARQTVVGVHGVAVLRAGAPVSLCRDVAAARRPIVLQDARRRLPGRGAGAWGFDLAGYAGVPLPLRDPDRAGAFAAMTSVARVWQSHDLHVLHCLSAAAAAVLDIRADCNAVVRPAHRLDVAAKTRRRSTTT
jgi:GAF domain-containing protein